MIYLIGGAPRVGKSTLANMLLQKKLVPYESTDSIYHMLFKAAPELNIKTEKDIVRKTQNLYPFLKVLITHKHWEVEDYCIEGDGFLPKQVHDFMEEIPTEKGITNFKIKVIFLGFSKVNLQTVLEKQGHNNWMIARSKEEQEEVVDNIPKRSEYIKNECQKYGFEYVDLAGDYQENLEKAYKLLTN